MRPGPDGDLGWQADYQEWLPRCTEWLGGLAATDPLAWDPTPGRDEILRRIASAARRDWSPELDKLEAHAHSVLGELNDQLGSLDATLTVDAEMLFVYIAARDDDEPSEPEDRVTRAGEEFVEHALELNIPISVSDGVSAFQNALAAILKQAAIDETAELEDAVVRAGAEAARLAYLLSAGRRGFGPGASASLPIPGDPFLIDVVHDDDPYWRGKPEAVRLIVMPRSEARRLAAFRRAVFGSSTWGEVLEKIEDPVICEHVISEFAELQDWGADDPNAAFAGVWIDLGDMSEDFIPDPQEGDVALAPRVRPNAREGDR